MKGEGLVPAHASTSLGNVLGRKFYLVRICVICEICGLKISSGIDVLFDVQHSETPGLHVEESPENFAEIVSVLVAARDGNLVDVHRSE
jgi:hypothetical protein